MFLLAAGLGLAAACVIEEPQSDDDDDGASSSSSQQGSGGTATTAGAGGGSAAGGSAPSCGSCENPCPGEPCVPRDAPATLPGQEWFGDFVIADFEYWPYANGDPSYPDDIGWGYHAGSEPAKKCMAESRAILVEILQDPPPELIALKEQFGTQGTYAFYNWNNDYTGAANDAMAQELFRHLWMWEESFIKWISETNRDGRCVLPSREDLVDLATKCMTQYPNCKQ